MQFTSNDKLLMPTLTQGEEKRFLSIICRKSVPLNLVDNFFARDSGSTQTQCISKLSVTRKSSCITARGILLVALVVGYP